MIENFITNKEQVVNSDGNIEVELKLYPYRGRSCFSPGFSKYKEPVPIKFIIPQDAKLTLDDWIPTKLDDSKPNWFNGVDRSKDSTNFAGIRYRADLSGLTIEETIIKMQRLMDREGARSDLLLLPPQKYVDLVNSLEHRVQFARVLTDSGVGYDGIFFQTQYSKLGVLLDPTLTDKAYMIQTNTWNKDKVLACETPRFNGVIVF